MILPNVCADIAASMAMKLLFVLLAVLATGCNSAPPARTANAPYALADVRPVLSSACKLAIQDAVENALPFEVFCLDLRNAEPLEEEIGPTLQESAGSAFFVEFCRKQRAPAGIPDYRYVGPTGATRCVKVFASVDRFEGADRARVTYGWDQHKQAMRMLIVTMEQHQGRWIVIETTYDVQS